jgi:hypothetical protein
MQAEQLSDDELIICFDEEQKGRHWGTSEQQCCLELMRRAFTERSAIAMEKIDSHFGKLFRDWVRRDPLYAHLVQRFSPEVTEDIIQDTYVNLIRTLGNRTDFNLKFDYLCPKFLGYVHACIHGAIRDLLRGDGYRFVPPTKNPDESGKTPVTPKPPMIVAIDDFAEIMGSHDNYDGLIYEQVYRRVRAILSDDNEWNLFNYTYRYEMTPRQIVATYSENWDDAHQISVRMNRIRGRLYKDPLLRELFGLEPPNRPSDPGN